MEKLEMLAIKSENADFALSPGRDARGLRGGPEFDFTVAGTATDPNQCLEQVKAVNGTFYAECKK